MDKHSEQKVNSLRASYRRELQKIRSEKSGAGTDDVYQLSLWYFNDSSFLHDTESSVDGITSFDDGQENETPKASKRRHYESSEFLQKAIAHLDNISAKQPKCEADIYAEGWAAMFKQLSKEQQLFAKKGMDELLMQGRMNMLTYQEGVIKVLLGIQKEFEGRKDSTPLIEAAFAGHNDIVMVLLSHNVDVNARCANGNTPLMLACGAVM
ncbi:uncharacterized protein LOC133849834 [Drosophila sulfurigaster albostrigata]|uniref:uncharacterized protein LOC133849834 n=1 Tax=Drosophila sulfurigaster albostrigata TaxID=89887 RepID=UPI002D21ABE7|nr:uncharacterized protein LOC133849834 [Drosophila sulfurigaster albostrigata]